jgi:hypothetical protein
MVIFVGDKPSAKMKPGAKPFEGAACEKRLNDWKMHLLISEMIIMVNKDDHDAQWFLNYNKIGAKIITLGNNASKQLSYVQHFKLPHPSGRNRQLNDKKFIEQKLKECREWLKT